MSEQSQSSKKSKKNKENASSKDSSSNKSNKNFKWISEEAYNNSKNNFKNVSKLMKDLKSRINNTEISKAFEKFEKEENVIQNNYINEDEIKNVDIDKWKLNNNLFKYKVIKIISDVHDLKEYNSYPYFDIDYSKTKKTNIIKIYFNHVEIFEEGENNPYTTIFLDDRDTYFIAYKNIPIIIQKYEEEFKTVTIFSKDYQNSIDLELNKINEKEYQSSFILAEINSDLMLTKKKLKELKNKMDSIENKKEKDIIKAQLSSYQKILESQNKIYSKKNIENLLENKKNELIILEENLSLIEPTNNNKKEEFQIKIDKIKDEIIKIEDSLKTIIIKIQKMDMELDGLCFSSKEILLKNSIGDELKIPAKSPIIIDVKNIIKYKTIIDNIRKKKKLMNTLGFDTKKFYFISILRGIDVDKKKKEEINNKIFQKLNMENMIVIYPENLKFLNVELLDVKNEIKSEEEKEKKPSNCLKELMKEEFDKIYREISTIKLDISSIKSKISDDKTMGHADKAKDK